MKLNQRHPLAVLIFVAGMNRLSGLSHSSTEPRFPCTIDLFTGGWSEHGGMPD